MKKAIKINLGGLIFHIDEEAYNKLQAYLTSLSNHFGNNAEAKEIISDIESRMAELFQVKLTTNNQVITDRDVDDVLRILGNPSEIDGNQEEEKQSTIPPNSYQAAKSKKFYRDIENSVLGGVCSGLGAYFNTDPVIFRIIFLIMLFFGGAGAPIYIILWIAIPPARTAAQKLEMKGESVTVSNIERAVKEEYTRVQENFKNMDAGKKARSFFEEFFGVLGTIFIAIFKVIGVLVGVILTIVGIALITAFVFSISGHPVNINNEEFQINQLPLFINQFLGNHNFFMLALAAFLVVILPIIGILWIGLKLIFRFKTGGRFLGLFLVALWILSIIILVVYTVSIARNFTDDSTKFSVLKLNTKPYKEIYLQIDPASKDVDGLKLFISARHDQEYYITKNEGIFGRPEMTITKADDNEGSVSIEKMSHGRSYDDANRNAREIIYDIIQKDSLILFDSYFLIPVKERWRAQRVEMEVRIPVGTIVHLDEELDPIFKDAINTENLWHRNMLGRKWVMTEDGLAPVNKDN